MTFNLTNDIGTGTDEELLAFARAAIAEVLARGQAVTIRGRVYDRADLPELRKLVEWLEARIDAAAGETSNPTTTYAQFRRPV